MPVDKLLLSRRVADARGAIRELERLAGRPFEELNIDQLYAMRYNIIVLVEALVSLAIHVLREEQSYRPTGYTDAVERLSAMLGLDAGCVSALKALVRLRNLLVHRYWNIDDKLVYENIKRDFRCVETLLERVYGRYGCD